MADLSVVAASVTPTVQGRPSLHPADGPNLIVYDCPRCGRRSGVSAPGPAACECGVVEVLAFDGWTAGDTDKTKLEII